MHLYGDGDERTQVICAAPSPVHREDESSQGPLQPRGAAGLEVQHKNPIAVSKVTPHSVCWCFGPASHMVPNGVSIMRVWDLQY